MAPSSSNENQPRRSRRRRRCRRTEGHEDAQALAEAKGHESVPEHPYIPRGTPPPLTRPEELTGLADHVRAAGSFAYDTEFIGEETYHPRTCLVQIATRERVALIDPLEGLDLGPIWELIADSSVETIVHAGAQDLEPVVRLLGRPPAAVFDTQIAAAFAGRPYPLALRELVAEFVGVRLGKGLTFTKWDRRPLSRVHARYAADDVRYLPAVREALRGELAARGNEAWVEEECGELSDVARYRFDALARLARIVGNRFLKPAGRAILRELLVLRDGLARERDVPPRTCLPDDVLWRLAKDPVRTADRLAAVKGFPRPMAKSHGAAVVGAIERGLEPASWTDLPEPLPVESPADRVCIDSLWALVCGGCRGRSIDPGIVASRRDVAAFHFAQRAGEPDPAAVFAPRWRRELVGGLLEEILAGRCALRLEWSGDRLVAETTPRGGRAAGGEAAATKREGA